MKSMKFALSISFLQYTQTYFISLLPEPRLGKTDIAL